jgi:phytoene dehydrogenase-like protein
MNDPYDAVIIGAGISGLFAENFLAKKGAKTLICEQHTKLGGVPTAALSGKMAADLVK